MKTTSLAAVLIAGAVAGSDAARVRVVPLGSGSGNESAPAQSAPASEQAPAAEPSGQERRSDHRSGPVSRVYTRALPQAAPSYQRQQVYRQGVTTLEAAGRPHEARTHVVRVVPQDHGRFSRDSNLQRHIERHRHVEVVANRHYRHHVNGHHYSHYYHRGRHWYGFYSGPHFYWTHYWGNRWWWRDPYYNRWAFWYDGYWWWPGPAGALYVYVNNDYYPYDRAPVAVQRPMEVPPAPEEATPPPSTDATVKSPDGRRMIQVVGDQGDAFLYDTSWATPRYLKYLGKDVERARFSGGTNGRRLEILIDFRDGRYQLFNAEGDPLDGQVPVGPPPPPPDVR